MSEIIGWLAVKYWRWQWRTGRIGFQYGNARHNTRR